MAKSKKTSGLNAFHLKTKQVLKPLNIKKVGSAYIVDKDVFPALNGITCFTLELWEECMRLPHWHPNAAELGYVVSGSIEVLIWRSPGETAVFIVSAGMCWFIPQSALHSLNNVGKKPAELLVSFSSDRPQHTDLPVAFNGIPAPIRNAYTSPHEELRAWKGIVTSPLVGRCPVNKSIHKIVTGSPYAFDLAKVTPLFNDANLGSVVWGVKSNWSILETISMLRAHLKPGVARDAIWYPDVATLYIVTKGKGQFHMVMDGQPPAPFEVKQNDFIFIPVGILHTFLNITKEDFEVIAFFPKADPQPEVSLAVATSFFPDTIRKAALTEFGEEHKPGDPLKYLNFTKTSPYLLRYKKVTIQR